MFFLFFQEPTHLVVFDIAFKTDTYFDGALGVLKKVKNIAQNGKKKDKSVSTTKS